jgi:hypothetical protein
MPSAVSIHICRGPEMERCRELEQASAMYCPACRRRTVQTLVSYFPKMDPDTMREDQMLAAAFYGPSFRWECSCGGSKHAAREIDI